MFKVKNYSSPLFIFILFSWVGFGFKLPFILSNQDIAFFQEGYYYNFFYNPSYYKSAFMVFLIGYFAFYLGYQVIKNKQWNLKNRMRINKLPKPLTLTIAAFVLITIGIYVRARFNIAVPGLRALIELSGYIYYIIDYSALILVGFQFFIAFKTQSITYLMLSYLSLLYYGISESILGWKGGWFQALLPVVLLGYCLWKQKICLFKGKFLILAAIIMLMILSLNIFLFPAIASYRNIFIKQGSINPGALFQSIKEKDKDDASNMEMIFKRFSGIDNLFAVIAFFNSQDHDFVTNDFYLLANRNDKVSAVQYFTWNILGGSREVISANAPTIWGVLYMYGGILFVALGLFAIGIVSKYIYIGSLPHLEDDVGFIVLYVLFISKVFLNIVFEGNMLSAVKSFIALYLVYNFLIFIFRFRLSLRREI